MESEQNWLLHLTVNQAPSAYGVRVPGSPPSRSEIAQSVERRTVNPQVPGSSPGFGAKNYLGVYVRYN